MVTIDGDGVDWTGHAKDDIENYALMAFNSSNSGSYTKVTFYSKECEKTYAKLKKLYDEQREQLGDACIDIQAYTLALKKSDAPIIEEYKSDNDDEYVFKATVEQEIHSCAFINTVKHVKSPRQTVKDQETCSQNPKVDKRDWTGLMSKRLGLRYGYTRKACFACGSFSHLIRDCKFHEKRIVKHVELNKSKNNVTSQRNDTPVFSWVFFLRTKDETSRIFKDFIRQIENQLNQQVKTIRCDNGIEFKNRDIIEFYASKEIKREYSNARTPQQNKVAERKNRTLIEAARTMLANSFLPNTFWAEAVSTACYVLNKVSVTKPQKETPYELITSKIPIICYIRPFGCHVTILNTIDHLGKFEEKYDKRFLVGYSLNSKAFRVYNLETKRVKENMHINILENKPNVAGKGPTWLFDLDYLTNSINYQPVTIENKANKTAGPKEANNSVEANNGDQKLNGDTGSMTNKEPVDQDDQTFLKELKRIKRQANEADDVDETLKKTFIVEDIHEVPNEGIFTSASYDAEGKVADFINLESTVNMDVKSAFLYGKIDKELYLSQPQGFIDPKFSKKVYKVVKALYGLYQAPRAWYATLSTFLVKSRYRKGIIDNNLFIKKDKKDIMLREDGIFISHDKYVVEILKKFDFMSVKTSRTPTETKKPLVKDTEAADVDVHIYRSMIGSLMYLTASRPDIMRLISWQCKKQTIVATSTTEAKYVTAANCCGQVLWIQNQMLDYGFNFMNTKIYIDNESTICNFNKLDDLVGEGADYAVNKGRSANKIKVLNAKAKRVSAAGETLSTATLAVSTARSRMKRMSKRKKTDADLEEKEQLRIFLNIIPDEEREVNYAVLDKRYP
uniref:Ribonuclease H-like domain-containing protein n=1 Tax=Tanacetum cinerariifolium TaxID=118510 RepID=A0A6L2L3U7_TANCI|nr:ribonuclease H-like domain-containing protein [Tanacetum cinerariifolium]